MVIIIGVLKSHPSRVRGLKLVWILLASLDTIVAPFAGAWIEIFDHNNTPEHA